MEVEAACDMRVAGMMLRQLVSVLRFGHRVAEDTHDIVMTKAYENDNLLIKPGTPVQRVIVSKDASGNYRAALVATVKPSAPGASYVSAVYALTTPRDLIDISVYPSEYQALNYAASMETGAEPCLFMKTLTLEDIERMYSAEDIRRATI